MGGILSRRIAAFCVVGFFVMIGILPMAFGAYYTAQYSTSICLVDDNDGFIKNNDFTVTITKPRGGYLYINDIEQGKNIIDDVRPHIIGPITVNASVTGGEGGIRNVVFYINDLDFFNDTAAPYSWKWSFKLALGENIVKVRAYDNHGNFVEDSISVLIIQIQNE